MPVDLRQVIGLGVAGNFAGHLEQAGEADDFKDLVIKDADAPKGIFPFYVPGGSVPGGSVPGGGVQSEPMQSGSYTGGHENKTRPRH